MQEKAPKRVLGLDKVIAFTYSPAKDFDPKQLRSVTFFGPSKPEDWQYWQARGVVTGVGHTWFDLLRSPLDKAVDNLVDQSFGGNPQARGHDRRVRLRLWRGHG